MAGGVARSDFTGFRYKPREVAWPDDFALKREFENIAVSHNGLITRLNEVVGGEGSGVAGPKTTSNADTDVLVKVSDVDNIAGYLAQKLLPGPGITFSIFDTGANGLAIQINAENQMIVCVHEFNTNIDPDTKLPRTGDALLEETFPHLIDNEFYTFEVFRPFEDYDTLPVDKWPDGTIRGRYQIRWKNVIHKEARRFGLRFHQPEFGTIVLYGASTVHRV